MTSSDNGHGGAREGAGRGRILERWQQLWLGEECEAKWRALAANLAGRGKTEWEKEIRDLQHDLHTIPIHKRGTSVALERVASTGRRIDKILSEHTGRTGRYRQIPVKRPHGARDAVIKGAIRTARAMWGVRLKKNYIEDCWKKYRGLLASQT
jgi:hypothetical protein